VRLVSEGFGLDSKSLVDIMAMATLDWGDGVGGEQVPAGCSDPKMMSLKRILLHSKEI
jgi:hypothetical protein